MPGPDAYIEVMLPKKFRQSLFYLGLVFDV